MATATDVLAPYWQVFEPPMSDKSTTEFEYVEYQQRDATRWTKLMAGSTQSKHEIRMRTYYHIRQYLRCVAIDQSVWL